MCIYIYIYTHYTHRLVFFRKVMFWCVLVRYIQWKVGLRVITSQLRDLKPTLPHEWPIRSGICVTPAHRPTYGESGGISDEPMLLPMVSMHLHMGTPWTSGIRPGFSRLRIMLARKAGQTAERCQEIVRSAARIFIG